MCGIFCILKSDKGKKLDAVNYTIQSLVSLEYRGYDSCGISFIQKNKLKTIKSIGCPGKLLPKIKGTENTDVNVAIGHNRWATHGGITIPNTHPHFYKNFAIVHNGIVENHSTVRKFLSENGLNIKNAQSDTAVLPYLMHFFTQNKKLCFKDAFVLLSKIIKGSSAIVAINAKTGELCATATNAPMLIGKSSSLDTIMLSSDHSTMNDCDLIFPLTNGAVFYAKTPHFCNIIRNDSLLLIRCNKEEVFQKSFDHIEEILSSSQESEVPFEKNLVNEEVNTKQMHYEHFMHQEIHEQPEVLENIIDLHKEGYKELDIFLKDLHLEEFETIFFVACGSSYNVSHLLANYASEVLDIDCRVKISSEFSQEKVHYGKKALGVFISQSGETMDSIIALKHAKENGLKILSILSSKYSSMEKLSDFSIFVHSKKEISVAATKSFTAQFLTGILILIKLAVHFGKISAQFGKKELEKIESVPSDISKLLKEEWKIHSVVKQMKADRTIFFIGRLFGLSLAMEGSLKMKEISYIPSEALPSGELKHGHLAVVGKKMTTVVILLNDKTLEKSISSIFEIDARHGNIIAVCSEAISGRISLKSQDFQACIIPQTNNLSEIVCSTVALQLLAYFKAKKMKCPIDKPRNLAKSLTVE